MRSMSQRAVCSIGRIDDSSRRPASRIRPGAGPVSSGEIPLPSSTRAGG